MTSAAPSHVVIAGMGAAGSAVFVRLVEAAAAGRAPSLERLTLIDPPGTFGHGVAYSNANATALLNRRTEQMDAVRPQAFLDWMDQRLGVRTDAPADGVSVPESYQHRVLFGRYLADAVSHATEVAAGSGIGVEIIRSEVTAVDRAGHGGVLCQVERSEPVEGTHLVLATGAQRRSSFPQFTSTGRYCEHAPPFGQVLHDIPPDAAVGILGTRLSGVDVALHLEARGHDGPVLMASRSGQLPSVRAEHARESPGEALSDAQARVHRAGRRMTLSWATAELARYLQACGASLGQVGVRPRPMTGREAAAGLERDLESARDAALPWQDALGRSNPLINRIWRRLDHGQRGRYRRFWHSSWVSRRVPIPLQAASALHAQLLSGRTRILAPLRAVTSSGSGFAVSAAHGPTEQVDWLIDATGASTTGSAPIRSLVEAGMAAWHPWGGIHVDPDSCAVLPPASAPEPDPRVFALGALTCGENVMTSAIDVVADQARTVADGLIAQLEGERQS